MTPEQLEEYREKGHYTGPQGMIVFPYENVNDKLLGRILGELIEIKNLLKERP